MKITYQKNLDGVTPEDMSAFCVGWREPIPGDEMLQIFRNSYRFVLARTEERVVGFVNSLSDGLQFAFIPMLEVLPEYQGQGIGTQLLEILFDELADITNVDLTCDPEKQGYYERFGMLRSHGMVFRKYLERGTK